MQLKTGLQFTASCIEGLVIILYNYIEKLRMHSLSKVA